MSWRRQKADRRKRRIRIMRKILKDLRNASKYQLYYRAFLTGTA